MGIVRLASPLGRPTGGIRHRARSDRGMQLVLDCAPRGLGGPAAS